MKKKVLIMLLILSLVLVAAFGLVACDKHKGSETPSGSPSGDVTSGEIASGEDLQSGSIGSGEINSSEQQPIKLQVPQNLEYNSETQQISWDEVENAVWYELLLNGRSCFTKKTTYNMSEKEGGVYECKVRAIGDNVNYLHSDTISITFEKEIIGGKKQLDTIANIFIEDGDAADYKVIRWDYINNADKYLLIIDDQHIYISGANNNYHNFLGEPGHYELIKVQALASDNNENYVSGEFTVFEGSFDLQLTYDFVIKRLSRRIEEIIKNRFKNPKVNEIIGIDAQTERVYFILNDRYMATVHLPEIGACYKLESFYKYVKQLRFRSEEVAVDTSNIVSENDAQLIAKYAINKGCVSGLQGYNLDDVKWCIARSFVNLNKATTRIETVIVTNDNKIISFELFFTRTFNDFEQLTVQYNCEVLNESVKNNTAFPNRFI